jgi:hypothetical protein
MMFMNGNKYRNDSDGRGDYWDGTPEEEAAYLAITIPLRTTDNLQALWQAATSYQETFISNAAYGLLAMGCMQGKPKCMACMGWINTIWTDHYYIEKPKVDHLYAGYDFSVVGPMPYTVPELTAEVLG